ncbi:molybdopterin biosynthesis protein MoeB [Lacunisphaera limnophila]|uniref:Molybdopterin biosynthesis protein MoeB n=1 Tax=Lacunisphaera limnophila TaxID=1838286 RepID=A0A1D8ATC7_9BACT|nr:rhodanese-like domain-containing protein [Lacunisphaera limnophila]AOS44143.1 molybdopterin biosynthesis protein MoeB [Lacunisphaera limnophila]
MNLPVLFLILAGAFVAWTFWRARPEILPEALHAALKAGTAVLVDVREPAEWTAGTAKQAALLPLSDLRGPRSQWRTFLEKNRDKELLLYCQSGARSAVASALLRREGFTARNAGSLASLDRAGWPVCRPRT